MLQKEKNMHYEPGGENFLHFKISVNLTYVVFCETWVSSLASEEQY